MDYDTFLRRVQEVAELPTRDDAERITRVVLNTLSERLHHTDRSALASQLPSALRALMEEHTDTDRYDLPEFYRRVALRADTSLADGGRALAPWLGIARGGHCRQIRCSPPYRRITPRCLEHRGVAIGAQRSTTTEGSMPHAPLRHHHALRASAP